MSVGTFETIPHDVQAIQWTGDNTVEVLEFCPELELLNRGDIKMLKLPYIGLYNVGAWVICDDGEYDCMTNATFQATCRKRDNDTR